MINNRQNGRRRGRGGPQMRGAGNGPGAGNRIDNRARGNAAQLHEKYRNLARDAQTQGDRVMTEYYLQFADHYFRVLSENRARFEENQPRRQMHDDLDGDDEGDGFDDRGHPPRQEQRNERGDQRFERNEQRFERTRETREETARDRQPAGQDQVQSREDAPQAEDEAPQRSRRARRPRREASADAQEAAPQQERIEIDRLPPAFVPASPDQPSADSEEGAEPPKRRRTRRAAKEDGDSVAA